MEILISHWFKDRIYLKIRMKTVYWDEFHKTVHIKMKPKVIQDRQKSDPMVRIGRQLAEISVRLQSNQTQSR